MRATRAPRKVEMSEKQRIIQEFVPGKQVTLAHVVANPDARLYPKIGLPPGGGAIGVMTITPSEATVIAADVATKAAARSLREVRIGVWWPFSERRVTWRRRSLPLSRRTS